MALNNRHTALVIRQRRKQRQKQRGSAQRLTRWFGFSLLFLIIAVLVAALGTIGTGVAVYARYARQLPPADAIVDYQASTFKTTVLYDRTGNHIIYEVIDPQGGDRKVVSLDDVPEYFLQATIAIEDKNFYTNPGFNLEGMLRALWNNLSGGELQGGSSITQQLVKNTLIDPEERDEISFDRKLKELILATELSERYSKDQILEWYINTNFYGNFAYGIEAAARAYFDKPARDLTLAEATMLAAIPQSPKLNPIDDPVGARERQRVVLDEMVEQGYISREDANTAFAQPLILKPLAQRFDITAPHFSLHAAQEAQAILNDLGYDGALMVSRDGLRIYTTLDLDLQLQLECASRSHIERLAGNEPIFSHNTTAGTPCYAAEFLTPLPDSQARIPRPVSNAAGVVLNARTGEIRAMLGSVDYWKQEIDGNFNAALALRQPASTFKPFVYLTAFFNPLDSSTPVTAATMTYDVPTAFDNDSPIPYSPENIDRQFHGPVSVREALARSYNVPAVQVLSWVGLSQVLRTAHLMGINSMNENIAYGLSLALGTTEASLLDMTYSYNVLNNLGYMVGTPVRAGEARAGYRQLNPVAVLRIETFDGKILWQYSENKGTFDRRAILEPAMAYIMTDILSDNTARISPSFPRGNALELSRPAAVKTGTSDEYRDSWTIGYTPQYTVGIWVGNNDNRSMNDVTGLLGAAPIWHAVMEYIHARDQVPVEEWLRPPTVVEQNVCVWSGLRPTEICPQVTELFYYDPVANIDYRPLRFDSYWKEININSCNNTLATPYSPPECVEERLYFDYPPELKAWAAETSGVALLPIEYDVAGSFSDFSRVAIIEPQFLAKVGGQVEIRGNATDENFNYFRLDFGEGTDPSRWNRIGDDREEEGRGIDLGTWDTRALEDGLYTLRLTMVRQDTSIEVAFQQVTVDNTPPTIRLLNPTDRQTYSAGSIGTLELVAEVADNYQIAYVEFYRDGERIGEAAQGPYTYQWQMNFSGETTFWAVVVDRAGNLTTSERATVLLTP